MACLINRNNEGKIIGVIAPNGSKSQLFEEIHSIPFLGDAAMSINIMSSSLAESVQDQVETYSNEEPKLFFKSPNNKEFEDLESAVLNDEAGTISIGFKNKDNQDFIPIARFNTNASETSRFINEQIIQGVLNPKRILGQDGITRFQGKGEFEETREATAKILQLNSILEMGIGNTKANSDGTFEISFPSEIVVGEINGKFEALRLDDVLTTNKTFDNQAEILMQYHTAKNNFRPLDNKQEVKPELNIAGMENSLYRFLESLGFTSTTLTDYRKNFNTKYGQDPDIDALTDISNRVVAFTEGRIPMGQLSEEVAHIAIAAYSDQNSIISAMSSVQYSPEYTEYADYYRQKYEPFYEGIALEDQVRKEILGKVLTKEFANRFEQTETSEEQSYLRGLLRTIWDNFTQFISNRFKPYHRRVLDDLNKKIADSVVVGDMSNFENNLAGNRDFYYSASTKEGRSIDSQLSIAKKGIEDMFRGLKERIPRSNELDNIYENMIEIDTLKSVNLIVDISANQMNIIQSNVKKADAEGTVISIRDTNAYNILSGNIMPILGSLKLELNRLKASGEFAQNLDKKEADKRKQFVEDTISKIDEINTKKLDIEPIMNKDNDRLVTSIWERIFGRMVMTDEQRLAERAKIDGNIKDLSFFGRLFGLATTSQNPIIQLMALKIVEMRTKVNTQFIKTNNEVIKKVYDRGLEKYQRNIIKKDSTGKKTHYFFSPVDWTRIDTHEESEKVKWAAELSGKSEEEVRKLIKSNSYRVIINDVDKYKDFLDRTKKLRASMDEKCFTDVYYERGEERFKQTNVSPITQETLRNFNFRANEIYQEVRNVDGTVDKSKLSEGQKKALLNIRRDKDIAKSAYDVFGELKDGLRAVTADALTPSDKKQLKDLFNIEIAEDFRGDVTLLDKLRTLDSLSEESRISLDMGNLSMLWMKERGTKKGKPSDVFLKTIEDLEANGENAFEWVMSNANLTLTDEYYSNLGVSQGFNQVVEEYLQDNEGEEELSLIFEQYKDSVRRRKNLLKQNRRLTNPIETDVKNMDSKVQKTILDLDTEIRSYRRTLTDAVLAELFEEIGGTGINSVRGVNDDYQKLLTESGLSEYDFCLKHMTTLNRLKTEKFAYQISALINGKRVSIDSGFERFFQDKVESGSVDAQIINGVVQNKEEVIQQLINEYAKENVGSYFQRFAPEGYPELLAAMENGDVKMSNILSRNSEALENYSALENITISPDYTWTEDISNNEYNNTNYKKGGYFRKPKKEWLDQKWFDHYGISIDSYLALPDDDISKLTPTKNIDEFEFLKTAINLREQELKNYGDTEKINKWQLVQLSSRAFEKIFTAGNFTSAVAAKATGKDLFKDIVRNRPDELDYGTQVEGEDLIQQGSDVNVKIIPKYYQEKLEDPEAITENVLEAVLMGYRQSLMYKERKGVERDVKALQWKLANQRFKGNGSGKQSRILKTGAVTNYYKMGQEYMDHHLYGIQQTRSFKTQLNGREIDLTRIVNHIQGFARFTNLAYNLYVDATGATTGNLNKFLDTLLGDYYEQSSAKRANSQFVSMLTGYVSEIGGVNKKSKLNALLEEFDVVNPEDRLKNSKYNKAGKLIQRSPYLLSKASNMTLTPRVLLSILNDYRFIEGEFRSFNEFKVMRGLSKENSKQGQAVIKAEWKKLADNSLYDYLDITENGVKPKLSFNTLFENPAEAYEQLKVKIVAKTKQINQTADGVLNEYDQVAAQRDVLTNAVMMHRGWFLIGLTRRFKAKSFNASSGQYEEGHYRTLLRFINEIVRRKEGKTSFKEWYANAEGYEKRNIRRSLLETGVLFTILALGEAVLATDDEDDLWLEDFGRLIYLRTASEFSSSQLVSIPGTIQEIVKSPLTAMRTYEMLNPIDYFREGWEDDKDFGTKGMRKLIKGTIARRYLQYGDIQEQVDSFRFFNDPTLWNLGPDQKDDESEHESQGSIKIK